MRVFVIDELIEGWSRKGTEKGEERDQATGMATDKETKRPGGTASGRRPKMPSKVTRGAMILCGAGAL